MSTETIAAIVAIAPTLLALATLLSSIAALVTSLRNGRKADENGRKVDEIKTATDGMKDQLMQATRSDALQEGHTAGMRDQKNATDQAQT